MKYESFNIEPGQTSWFDMPEDYKKAYFANLKVKPIKTGRIPAKDRPIAEYNLSIKGDYSYTKNSEVIWRVFDPLKPQTSQPDCVFHIPVHVEERERDSDSKGMIEDFIVSRRCIEHFRSYIISQKIPDLKVHLVVSINGKIDNPKFIEYFNGIN